MGQRGERDRLWEVRWEVRWKARWEARLGHRFEVVVGQGGSQNLSVGQFGHHHYQDSSRVLLEGRYVGVTWEAA